MDNFFSFSDLYDDLTHKKIFWCGMVRLHRKGMPKDLKPKTVRLKRGDIRVRTRGDLTAVVWKDKRDLCLLTNIHDPPREGNYRNEHGNAIKPASHVFNEGRDANRAIQMCHVWRGALCGPKLFWRLPHQKPLIRLFFLSLCKLLEPRPKCK